jgi:hypothetical protein
VQQDTEDDRIKQKVLAVNRHVTGGPGPTSMAFVVQLTDWYSRLGDAECGDERACGSKGAQVCAGAPRCIGEKQAMLISLGADIRSGRTVSTPEWKKRIPHRAHRNIVTMTKARWQLPCIGGAVTRLCFKKVRVRRHRVVTDMNTSN